MKKTTLFFTGIIIAMGTAYYIIQGCSGPECYVRQHLKEYKTETVYQDSDRLYGALFKTKSASLRADIWLNTDQIEAASIIKNHTIRMDALYEKAVSPYPGEASNAIFCDPQYRPKHSVVKNKGRETHVFVGYANERMAFGSCADDLVTQRAAVVMFYCEILRKLYKFELFSSTNNPAEAFTGEVGRLQALPCNEESI